MKIIVNTDRLKSTASNLESIISDLSEKRKTLIQIQSSLDYSIRYRSNINQTIAQLSSRLYESQLDLNRIKNFLNTTANKYEAAEESITRALNKMEQLTGCSVNGTNLDSTGAIQGSAETKPKWYQTAGKFLVGTGVIVGAGAIAFFGSGIIATLAAGACIGATLGAGISVISGIGSNKSLDGIASSFMKGSITGAITGAITAATANAGPIISAVSSGGGDVLVQGFNNVISGESFFKDSLKTFVTGATISVATYGLTKKLPKIASEKSQFAKKALDDLDKEYVSKDIQKKITGFITKHIDYTNPQSMTSKCLELTKPFFTNQSSKLVKFLNWDIADKISDDIVYRVTGKFSEKVAKDFVSNMEKDLLGFSPLTLAGDVTKKVVTGTANFIFAD